MTKEERRESEKHLGLVMFHVRGFVRKYPWIDEEELFQEAFLGMTKAVKGFNPKAGFTFSAYATRAIVGACVLWIRKGGLIRIARDVRPEDAPAFSFVTLENEEVIETDALVARDADPCAGADSEDEVRHWLEGLSPVQEFVVRGHVMGGRQIKELAAEVGVHRTTLSLAYAEAKRTIRCRPPSSYFTPEAAP